MWLGTWGAGLNRFDRKTGKFYRFMPNPDDPSSISNANVWDLFTDNDGKMWISYNWGGIDVLDVQKGVIKKYKLNPENELSIPGRNKINSQCFTKIDF